MAQQMNAANRRDSKNNSTLDLSSNHSESLKYHHGIKLLAQSSVDESKGEEAELLSEMTDDLKMIEDIADRLKIDSHMIRKKLKVIEEQPEAEHLPEVERLRFNFSLLADDMANELTKIRNKFRSNVVHNDVIEYSIECDNGNFDRKEMTKEHQNNILKEQPFEASSSESDSSSEDENDLHASSPPVSSPLVSIATPNATLNVITKFSNTNSPKTFFSSKLSNATATSSTRISNYNQPVVVKSTQFVQNSVQMEAKADTHSSVTGANMPIDSNANDPRTPRSSSIVSTAKGKVASNQTLIMTKSTDTSSTVLGSSNMSPTFHSNKSQTFHSQKSTNAIATVTPRILKDKQPVDVQPMQLVTQVTSQSKKEMLVRTSSSLRVNEAANGSNMQVHRSQMSQQFTVARQKAFGYGPNIGKMTTNANVKKRMDNDLKVINPVKKPRMI